jgi:hypothetical protein
MRNDKFPSQEKAVKCITWTTWTVFAHDCLLSGGPSGWQIHAEARYRCCCLQHVTLSQSPVCCVVFGPALALRPWGESFTNLAKCDLIAVVRSPCFWNMTPSSPAKTDVSKEHNSSILLWLQPESLLLLVWLTLRSASNPMGTWDSFPGGKSGRGVKLTIHLQRLPRSRKGGSIHPLLHAPSWRSA